jgi:hypothetical protein
MMYADHFSEPLGTRSVSGWGRGNRGPLKITTPFWVELLMLRRVYVGVGIYSIMLISYS